MVRVRLAGPAELHAADAAESAGGHLVGVDRVAVGPRVGHAVGSHGTESRLAGHLDAEVGVGAGVEMDLRFAAEQGAVLTKSGPHLDLRRVAPGGESGLLHGQAKLHRHSRGSGRQHGKVFHADVALGAETAADIGDLYRHLFVLQAEHAGQLVAYGKGGL